MTFLGRAETYTNWVPKKLVGAFVLTYPKFVQHPIRRKIPMLVLSKISFLFRQGKILGYVLCPHPDKLWH